MWWIDVIAVVLVVGAIWSFVVLVRNRTRSLSSHTDRRAEDLYDRYADDTPPSSDPPGGSSKP